MLKIDINVNLFKKEEVKNTDNDYHEETSESTRLETMGDKKCEWMFSTVSVRRVY